MARRYLATKPLIINGKKIKPGKQIVGVKKHRLEQLVRWGKARIFNDEPVHYVALREVLVGGEIMKPGQEIKGLTERKFKALVRMRVVKEVFESDMEFIEPEEENQEDHEAIESELINEEEDQEPDEDEQETQEGIDEE